METRIKAPTHGLLLYQERSQNFSRSAHNFPIFYASPSLPSPPLKSQALIQGEADEQRVHNYIPPAGYLHGIVLPFL